MPRQTCVIDQTSSLSFSHSLECRGLVSHHECATGQVLNSYKSVFQCVATSQLATI